MAGEDSTPYGVIYRIRNKINGKVYIGQTTASVAERWHSHCKADSYCVLLSKAIKKYGRDNFDVSAIDSANSKHELDEKEIFYINQHDSTNRDEGYNLREGGSFGKHSEESRERMSIAVRKAYENPEFKEKLIAYRTGKKWTPEYCERASQRMLGTRITPEAKRKISASVTEYWKSDEYRKLVSEGQSEARSKAEYIEMVAANTKAQWGDDEKRRRLVEAQTAGKRSMWADPERKAAILAKRAATAAAKKAALI